MLVSCRYVLYKRTIAKGEHVSSTKPLKLLNIQINLTPLAPNTFDQNLFCILATKKSTAALTLGT
jgi:hypothetical protein